MRHFLRELKIWMEVHYQFVYTIGVLLVDFVVGAILGFGIVKLIDWMR